MFSKKLWGNFFPRERTIFCKPRKILKEFKNFITFDDEKYSVFAKIVKPISFLPYLSPLLDPSGALAASRTLSETHT
jgi:hypothetical protein